MQHMVRGMLMLHIRSLNNPLNGCLIQSQYFKQSYAIKSFVYMLRFVSCLGITDLFKKLLTTFYLGAFIYY